MQSSGSQNNSSSEWIRPNADNLKGFSRPTSRNVMQIDHGSGMMTLLPESSSTPSTDDNMPPSSSRGDNVKQIQVLPIHDKISSIPCTVISARLNTNNTSSDDYISTASPPKRDVNPAILTNTINTGSEFRFKQLILFPYFPEASMNIPNRFFLFIDFNPIDCTKRHLLL